MFENALWRFGTSGTLILFYGIAEHVARHREKHGTGPVSSPRPRWERPLLIVLITGFYLLIKPAGGALWDGLGNWLGVALVAIALAVRLSRSLPHADLGGRSLFYLALPIAVGVPWGLVVLSLPAVAISVHAWRRAERRRALLAAAVVLAALGAFGTPRAALADDSDTSANGGQATQDSAAASVRDTVTLLPPYDVEADRLGETRRRTATTVRLSGAGVQRFLPSTSGDALLTVPGLDLVKTGPWASRISLRGVSGDRVLLMVDGVRVNSVRGHGGQVSLVPVENLDAVELLPGANSAQYGSDAIGGVVNLITHRGLTRGEPQLGAGLYTRGAGPGGAWRQGARVRWSTPRFGAEVTGGLGGLDALETPSGSVANSGHRQEEIGGRAQVLLGSAVLDFEQTYAAARDIGLPAFSGSAGASGSYPLQDRMLSRLELSLPGGGFPADARLLAVRQSFRTEFVETTVDSAFVRGSFVGTRTTRTEDRVKTPIWSVQPELSFRSLAGLRLAGEYRREETSGPRSENLVVRNAAGNPTSESTTGSESIPPATRDVWGASASASRDVAGLRLEAGVRYDHMRSRADSTETSSTAKLDVTDRRFSVEGGVARRIGLFEPYLHAATGFRAPNLQERYYNNDIHGGLRLFGNPDLVAERSHSFEAGLRVRGLWGGRLETVRASAYRSDVRDFISLAYLGQLYLVPRFQYVNVDRARLEGVEVTAQLRFGEIGFDVNASVPRGFDRDTGEKLLDAGTARVTLDVLAPLPAVLPSGRAAFRWRWSDAVTDTDPNFARPSFSTGDVELSSGLGPVRAIFAVRNLWNEGYREPLSFIEEPGRTFSLALQGNFTYALPQARRPGS